MTTQAERATLLHIYLSADGLFSPLILNHCQRHVLYGPRPTVCQINPNAYMPGRGLVAYGQKTQSVLPPRS